MVYAEAVNQTSIIDMFKYTNSVTDGIFGIGILISLYLIISMYLLGKNERASNSFAVSGFITTLIGFTLFLAGIINGLVIFFCISATALPMLWSYWSD